MSDETRQPPMEKTPPNWWDLLGTLAREKRQQPTPAEAHLWTFLRNRQLNDLKFRRQTAFGPFIVDFYCAEHHLVVEVDGPIHSDRTTEDIERQNYLEQLGLHVLRVTNEQVLQHTDEVLKMICAAIKSP
jgi:very-short-patch-repair endonuclease